MSYPCVICDEECLVDTIQCFQCEHWVHGECVPMTADLLQKWSDANMKFHCEDCCFADGHFDHKKSLQRLIILSFIFNVALNNWNVEIDFLNITFFCMINWYLRQLIESSSGMACEPISSSRKTRKLTVCRFI